MSTGHGGTAIGKKAVHVKWAGKTIALGTFPSAEADEKCARAKALTRAWRSTMRPKPTRDWVMVELERLGVRVVSGRLGRKLGEGDEEDGVGGMSSGMDMGPSHGDHKGSIGWNPSDDFDSMMQRRSSSLGFNRGSLGLGTMDDPTRRPFVGGGSAAAYEAARADHYGSMGGSKGDQVRSLGMGGGVSVNANQHYEMLKLHHMNLLNEIQETTLMMNLYQQQQLQQQQQMQQQQMQGREGVSSSAGGAAGMDPGVYGGSGPGGFDRRSSFGGMGPRASLGLGPRTSLGGMDTLGSGRASLGLGMPNGALPADKSDELNAAQEEQQALEERLNKIKEEIARRQKIFDELAAQAARGTKRKADAGDKNEKSEEKRVKKESQDDGDSEDDDDDDEEEDGDDDGGGDDGKIARV